MYTKSLNHELHTILSKFAHFTKDLDRLISAFSNQNGGGHPSNRKSKNYDVGGYII